MVLDYVRSLQLPATLMYQIFLSLGVLRLRISYKGKTGLSLWFQGSMVPQGVHYNMKLKVDPESYSIPTSSSHTILRENSSAGKGTCFVYFEQAMKAALHLERIWKKCVHSVFAQPGVSQGRVGHSYIDIAFLRVIRAAKSTGKKKSVITGFGWTSLHSPV